MSSECYKSVLSKQGYMCPQGHAALVKGVLEKTLEYIYQYIYIYIYISIPSIYLGRFPQFGG